MSTFIDFFQFLTTLLLVFRNFLIDFNQFLLISPDCLSISSSLLTFHQFLLLSKQCHRLLSIISRFLWIFFNFIDFTNICYFLSTSVNCSPIFIDFYQAFLLFVNFYRFLNTFIDFYRLHIDFYNFLQFLSQLIDCFSMFIDSFNLFHFRPFLSLSINFHRIFLASTISLHFYSLFYTKHYSK